MIAEQIDPDFAADLFERLLQRTASTPGVTRDSYGEGEQAAHDIAREAAVGLDLEISVDPAGNLFMTLPGADRDRPACLVGSHLDSVPNGGNFDGAAGVVAGLTAAAAFRAAGQPPPHDVTVVAIRAEESTWFPVSYIGSRAALGRLPPEALNVRRSDSGDSLAEHMRRGGFDPDAVARGANLLDGRPPAAFLELHIEQGPTLVEEDLPVGLVSGIRGSVRFREARCLGDYGHSGAVPRRYRHDALFGAAELVAALESLWRALEDEGRDLAITLGKFGTDPAMHAFSKIPGEVGFCIDVRSESEETLDIVKARLSALCRSIGETRGLSFELGPETASTPAMMDAGILQAARAAASELGLPCRTMPSGAGHDAAVFANAGIPSGMIFVRNRNGSHNPDEAMELPDFAAGCRLLTTLLAGALPEP